MPERDQVIDKYRIQYEGLFSVSELYKLVETWFEERNYDKREIKNVEIVKPDGKYIEIDIEPWKKISDYAKVVIHLKYIMKNITEVEIERDNLKVKLNQGILILIFDAWIETDHEGRWENKPTFFFLRTVFDKYIYKPYTMGYRSHCGAEAKALISHVKGFLNLYRHDK
jgi:hypothetical protein